MGSPLSKTFTESPLEKLEEDLKKENEHLSKLRARTLKDLEALENAILDIAITGVTGAGKSSLVNALRGIKNDAKGAAQVGATQTTMETKGYPHPIFPKVTIWDLPGIGTPDFQAKEYLQKVDFERYDFFIIASEQFTNNDIFLGNEIKNMNKKFYYVRTKVDVSVDSERRDRNISKEETLDKIRKDCHANLEKAGEINPTVFLISSLDLKDYDFQSLVDTLGNDLNEFKRCTLIAMVSKSSNAILEKKQAVMKKLKWKIALMSSLTGSVPAPVCNIPFLKESMRNFSKAFGLDEKSLSKLANQVSKPVSLLSSAITKTRIADQIDDEFVRRLLFMKCMETPLGERVVDSIPVLNSARGQYKSVLFQDEMLQSFLDDVQEDAKNVWARAFENSEPQT